MTRRFDLSKNISRAWKAQFAAGPGPWASLEHRTVLDVLNLGTKGTPEPTLRISRNESSSLRDLEASEHRRFHPNLVEISTAVANVIDMCRYTVTTRAPPARLDGPFPRIRAVMSICRSSTVRASPQAPAGKVASLSDSIL